MYSSFHPLTFYLNAYEIRSEAPSYPLEAFRISLKMEWEDRRHLSHILNLNNIIFHYNPSDSFGYKAGYYIYDVEKWSKIMDCDDVVSGLEHERKRVEAISYVVRGAILRLIEGKLRGIEGIHKVFSGDVDERKFCFDQDLLHEKSSIFGYHRCFIYRVEYFHRPVKKLLLLILPSLQVRGKESLEGLIMRGVPLKLLLGLPFKVKVDETANLGIREFIGYLENVERNAAIVRPADLTSHEEVKVPIKNLYVIGRIDLYKRVVEFLGEDYNLLYDIQGRLTFSREKGAKMIDAPTRMRKEVENLHRKIFMEHVFPLRLQNVTYTLSENQFSPEMLEE